MKDQYVGDINDYRKYALLRALSAGGANRIGVCWMMTPSDGGLDGGKLGYLRRPERHRQIDPELFDILEHATSAPDRRRLQTIEKSGATIPGAIYYNDLLPDDLSGRRVFMGRCLDTFHNVDLIFFDPDNGLEVSLTKGRKNSSKYLYLDEVSDFYAAGKSLLIYQHFPRIERLGFVRQCIDRLCSVATTASVWSFTTPHVVFFLLVHPESPARLVIAAIQASGRWDAEFISGQLLKAGPPAQ